VSGEAATGHGRHGKGWLLVLLPLLLLLLPLFVGALASATDTAAGGWSATAQAEIPKEYLPLYQQAAATCSGMNPALLAGVGKAESDHGRNNGPTTGVLSGANSAGAAGPMQIGIGGKAGNTWGGRPRDLPPVHPAPPTGADPAEWGYGIDASGDGLADVYEPADAIHGAARFLCDRGAGDFGREVVAVANYNCGSCGDRDPGTWPAETKQYVTKVLTAAVTYEAGPAGPAAAVPPGFGTEPSKANGFCGRSPSTDYARSLVLQNFGQLTIGDCAHSGHVENSDHYPDANGQAHALDIMVYGNRALGDRIAGWFAENHQVLNVKQIIWFGNLIDYRDANPAWHPCRDRNSSCAKNHNNHPHVGFRAGT
jgi:hypothetical protein